MALVITPGLTFAYGIQYTPTDFQNFLANAGIAGLSDTHMDSAERLVFKGTSFPGSPAVGKLAYRTDKLRLYAWDGTIWNPVAKAIVRTAVVAFTAGQVAIQSGTANQVTRSISSADRNKVVGVAAESISAAASGVFITEGIALVDVAAATSIAQSLYLSTLTSGSADAETADATRNGSFGIAATSTAGAGQVTAYISCPSKANLSEAVADGLKAGNSPSTTNQFLCLDDLSMERWGPDITGNGSTAHGAFTGEKPLFAMVVARHSAAPQTVAVAWIIGTATNDKYMVATDEAPATTHDNTAYTDAGGTIITPTVFDASGFTLSTTGHAGGTISLEIMIFKVKT